MPVSENNSAGRLYNLLQKAIASGSANRKKGVSPPLLTVWQQALGCTSKSETITAYLDIIELPDVVSRDWARAGLSSSLLWFMPKIKAGIIRYNFNEQWVYVVGSFATESMQALRGCADTLERDAPKRVLPNDVVKSLLAAIAELFGEVQSADLEPDLKHFLLKQLHLIEVALRRHQITGVAPVEEALDQIIGSANLKRGMWERAAKSPITRKITTFISRVLIAVTSSVVTTAIDKPPEPAQQIVVIFQETAEFWQGYQRSIALEAGSDEGEIEEQKALPDVPKAGNGSRESIEKREKAED